MNKRKIEDGIYMLSLNVEDMLFESMWVLPHGVTLNSYIIKGKDIAIVDGVIGWDGVPETLYENLGELDIDPTDIKYLIVNHVEPDHSGWINNFRKIKKDFTIVTTERGAAVIKAFYGDEMKIMVVKEGDSLDLGGGKVLNFYPVPNVHWPETMVTFETSSKALFTCDLYGSFGTIGKHCSYEEMPEEEQLIFQTEGIRYFTNVMMTFNSMLKKAIDKTKSLNAKFILPGHGPIYTKNPEIIINEYTKWTEFANGYGEDEITIVWGSMYGSTEKAVNFAKELLEKKGIKVNMAHMPYDTISDMMVYAMRSAAVIVASPTYEYKMFPPVANAIDELGRKRMSGKHALYFGSYGWSGGAKKELEAIIERNRMNWNFIDYIEFNGFAREEELKKIEKEVLRLVECMQDRIYK